MADNKLERQFLAFDVDKYGVQRIPGMFWVAIGVLARHWVLALAVFISARRSSESVLLLGDANNLWTMLAIELPVVLLAFVAGRREPGAGRLLRWLWRRGPELIAITAIANVAWTARLLMQSDYWLFWPELFFASACLLDVAIALAMYTTPQYRRLFAEFPAAPEPANK
jgi:Protein of unknown function (DUF2919)